MMEIPADIRSASVLNNHMSYKYWKGNLLYMEHGSSAGHFWIDCNLMLFRGPLDKVYLHPVQIPNIDAGQYFSYGAIIVNVCNRKFSLENKTWIEL